MKLVIDIPEEDYIRLRDEGMFGNVTTFKRAVRDGIPLAEVIEDIKAEIEELKSCCDDDWDAFLIGRKETYNNVLELIDKHISGGEK